MWKHILYHLPASAPIQSLYWIRNRKLKDLFGWWETWKKKKKDNLRMVRKVFVPLKEEPVNQHICCPRRILWLPIQFLPWIQHSPQHTSNSTPHRLLGKAMQLPIVAHPSPPFSLNETIILSYIYIHMGNNDGGNPISPIMTIFWNIINPMIKFYSFFYVKHTYKKPWCL